MENKATIIAVSGVVAMGIGMIALAAISGQPVDSKTIELVVTGLLGFSGGVGVSAFVSSLKPVISDKKE